MNEVLLALIWVVLTCSVFGTTMFVLSDIIKKDKTDKQ